MKDDEIKGPTKAGERGEGVVARANGSVHTTYRLFLIEVLRLLQDWAKPDAIKKQDLTEVKHLASKLKVEIPPPLQRGGRDVTSEISAVVHLLEAYYPSEGDSDALGEAVRQLDTTLKEHFGITDLPDGG